jgi:hypothetical protein
MKFAAFQRRAEQIFAGIPAELRQGVDRLEVSPDTLEHPGMPEVYTLGECATGALDLGMEGAGGERSTVHLYHGSFVQVARLEPGFDWEEELRETILHEVRHHRESNAGEDALEAMDWAEDENFKRRAGQPFDAFFFRAGRPLGEGEWEVDGDLFLEREVTPRELETEEALALSVGGEAVRIPLPRPLGEAHYVYLEGRWDPDRDVAVVLRPRRGAWAQLGALLSGRRPEAAETTLRLEPSPGETEETG